MDEDQTRVKSTHLEKDDAQRQELLSNIELVLGDADIPEEEVRQGISTGQVSAGPH